MVESARDEMHCTDIHVASKGKEENKSIPKFGTECFFLS